MLEDSYTDYILADEIQDVHKNFKIAKLLGKGAFGEVVHALDIKLGCECAVKILIKKNMLSN
jgi:serine/threonine protein kinase